VQITPDHGEAVRNGGGKRGRKRSEAEPC